MIDPIFPVERLDILFAMLAATVANSIGAMAAGRKHKPIKVEKFIIGWDQEALKERKEQTPEEMLAYVEQLNAALGGKDLRKQGTNKEPQSQEIMPNEIPIAPENILPKRYKKHEPS